MAEPVGVLEPPRPGSDPIRPRRRRWPLGRTPTLVIVGLVVAALVSALVILVRQGSSSSGGIPALPRIGPARDVYDGSSTSPSTPPAGPGARSSAARAPRPATLRC